MREKKNFAERTRISKEDRTRKKNFLVFEGNRTEGIYFNTINELKDKIGINPLIEIISIEKTYTEEGWSNPKKILEQLLKDLEEIENGKFSYKTLVDKIIEIIMEDKKFFSNISKEISLKEIIEDIKNEIESLDNIVENVEEDCEFLLNMIIKKLFLTIEEIPNILETVLKNIENKQITYSEDIDKMCLIVDRDKKSFKEEQYNYVKEECERKNFKLYVTNPCFEFWLLLHFDEVHLINKEELLENKRASSKVRFVESELKKYFPYNKNKYNAELLIEKIHLAIENEKKFCEDIEELKDKLGSNIGLLIQELKEK
ncbi:abortive phage resistance protein [Fusobacterium hwasookii ChDC F174]|uniref:Abortive phage resistance protein n=1 Tax=Fusobacterium hwasookii ChDC F174 TaxID=1307442 RepID=A0A0S2ZLF2_9FUSO|nr:RloB family protein [Fusobacterium hwasookii]ALQ39720.1 abortive phage resistance protein [Fusobacterium hwasookii ChDC F174]